MCSTSCSTEAALEMFQSFPSISLSCHPEKYLDNLSNGIVWYGAIEIPTIYGGIKTQAPLNFSGIFCFFVSPSNDPAQQPGGAAVNCGSGKRIMPRRSAAADGSES